MKNNFIEIEYIQPRTNKKMIINIDKIIYITDKKVFFNEEIYSLTDESYEKLKRYLINNMNEVEKDEKDK